MRKMNSSSSSTEGTCEDPQPEQDHALTRCDLSRIPPSQIPGAGRLDTRAENTSSSLERPEAGQRPSYGHMYSNLVIGGQARVHAGDQIINHYYPNANTEPVSLSGGAVFLSVFIETLIQLLVLLQRLMANIPSQVHQPLVSFEDAHGRRSQIDISFVASWDVFDVALRAAFANMPGHERVIQYRYRLSDAYQAPVLIDPNGPPDYVATFRPGSKFFMSMHFEWYEVSTKDCPRCRHLQSCASGLDTIW